MNSQEEFILITMLKWTPCIAFSSFAFVMGINHQMEWHSPATMVALAFIFRPKGRAR